MSSNRWFRGTLRFYWATQKDGCLDCEDSVYIVRAHDLDEALRRLVAIGRKREKTYKNVEGQETRERFASVTTLDALRCEDLDGVEVSSRPVDELDPGFTFDAELRPEASRPEHSGV